MIKLKCKIKLKWDYEGWRKLGHNTPFTQRDWNQTLVTRINQCSAHIHKASLRGGADTIRMNSNMFEIIESLEYYNHNGDKKLSKYNVIIDDLIYDDVVYVYNSMIVEDKTYRLVPQIKEKAHTPKATLFSNGTIETELGEVSFKIGTPKEVKEHKKELIAKIKIENYYK